MLSARDLISGFDSVWCGILPWLTPSTVATLNHRHKQLGLAVVPGEDADTRINDLVTEYAYLVAAEAYRTNRSADAVLHDSPANARIKAIAAQRLAGLSKYVASASLLSRPQEADARSLAGNILEFLADRSESFVAGTVLPGCGVLADQQVDFDSETMLVEVKSVSRNLRSRDLRQIFIYVALQSREGRPRWRRAVLLNPRRNTAFEFDIDSLFFELAGGRSLVMVTDEFLRAFGKTPFVAVQR